ncbi:cytochrome P450 [Colletotrichum tofieldiae]|nr:cytochrome P450 [Colletotrichum tofieldiae]
MDHFRKHLPEDLFLARLEIEKLVTVTFARTMKMLQNLSARNIILACVPILLYILIRRTGMLVFEAVVQSILSTFKSGVLSKGRNISGPAWQFPNGQIIDKFANGRAKSDEWRKKYGAVSRVWGAFHRRFITRPEDLRTFSVDGDKHGKHSNLGWFLDQLLGHCIGFLQGDEWKKKRQVFYPAFSHDGTTSRADSTEIAARKFIHDLPSTQSDGAAAKQKESFSFRIVEGFRQFPLFVTANVIYGPMSDAEKDELWALAEKRLALWPYAVIGGPYRFSWGGLFDRKT